MKYLALILLILPFPARAATLQVQVECYVTSNTASYNDKGQVSTGVPNTYFTQAVIDSPWGPTLMTFF